MSDATRKTYLTEEQLEDFRQQLHKLRQDLLRDFGEHRLAERELESRREVGDMPDKAIEESLREWELTLEQHDRRRLAEIRDALERIEERTYGICEESGEPIPIERLRKVPMARYTVEVQEDVETDQARHREASVGAEDDAYTRRAAIEEREHLRTIEEREAEGEEP